MKNGISHLGRAQPPLSLLDDSPDFEPKLPNQCELAAGKKQSFFPFLYYYPRTNEQISEQSRDLKIPKIKLFCGECGFVLDMLQQSGDRTSPTGNKKRLKKLIAQYQPAVENMQEPKLLTLTSPRFSDPRRGILLVRNAFKKLRRIKPCSIFFKDVIYGFHVKTKPGHEFNVHVHALVDTPYIPRPKLKAAWAHCLPGAQVVDIRKCQSGVAGLKYILKDIVKTKDLYGFDKEIGSSLKGSRLVQTAGTLWGSPQPAPKYECPRCGSTSWTTRPEDAGKLVVHLERKRIESQEVIIPYG